MGPSEQAYNIQTIGYWPYERYKISPIESKLDPTLGYVIFENNFPFYNNSGNNFKTYIDYDFRTVNTSYNYDKHRRQIDLDEADSFYFSVSTTRKYFRGYIYNSFIIELDHDLYQKCYLLYPTRIFLKPTNAARTTEGWRLQTSAVLLSASPYFFETTDHSISSRNINKKYYSNYDGKVELPITTNFATALSYQICASQQFNNKEILKFTDTYNPYQYNITLERPGTTIKPDSTHIYYHHRYYSPIGEISEISEKPVYNLNDIAYTVYILKYRPDIDPATQTFLLLQSAIDPEHSFNTYHNCVVTAVLNLNTTNFKYFAATQPIGPELVMSAISGVPGSAIRAKYITDSVKIKDTGEDVSSTVIYTNAAGAYSLFEEVSSNQNGFDTVTWDLKYPPHYYNFNLFFRDDSYYNQYSQESYLTFKLSADPTYSDTNVVVLSTYIYSDFQLLKLDLPTYGILDQIKFDITAQLDLFLSSLCCYYGETDVPYYALSPTWIPASSANIFKITYPNREYGEIKLNIFPTLSTLAGCIEPYFSTTVIFDEGRDQPGKNGINLFQTIATETQDYLESYVTDLTITQSMTGLAENPSRSLSGSNVCWFWSPTDPYMQLHTADTLSSIELGQSMVFSPETYRMVLSGYGPQTVVLSMSSEKYNEVASITSTPELFDIFYENRFVLGSYEGLNNQNFTRTITLTAGVPYKNRIYSIPDNYPVYWTWTPNTDNLSSITDSETPISLSAYALNTRYIAGETDIVNSVSSITFLTETKTTNLGESLHHVNIVLHSNTRNMSGSYIFSVDEFPDKTVLDPNFYTYYRNISSNYIGSTYTSEVLTRPLDYTSKYDFKINNNLLNRTDNTELVWSIRDEILPLSSISSTSAMQYDITGSRLTHITLSAINSIALGWVSGHTVSKTLTIYSLPTAEFDEPLLFNIYPEFYWTSGRNLTISDTGNYTNAVSPTAYLNTTSETYNFWLSANKIENFDNFIYSVGTPQISSTVLMNIPYNSSLISIGGSPISLTAFGKEFPANNGLFYQMSGVSGLYTKTFNITSQSIPFDTIPITPVNRFHRSPKLIPYNSTMFTFSATVTSLNIDTNRYLYVKQNVYSDPINSPDQPVSGTILYTLSSRYWSVKSAVDAKDGEFRIFALSIGDVFSPLMINDKDINTLYLTASAYIYKTIPETTFDNYSTYSSNKNLWNTVGSAVTSNKIETIVAYTTAGRVGMYISDYYTLTGKDIKIEVEQPYYEQNDELQYYSIDYGDKSSEIFYSGEYVKHSYFSAGSYTITLSSVYQSGEVRIITSTKPVTIYNKWAKYDQAEIRFLDETVLVLPYDINQIDIQPNEFGNVDIFNTAISRLEQNLDYIIANARTINTDSPTDVYGWLGTNDDNKSAGIGWHTTDCNSSYYNKPHLSVSEGTSYFTDIRSFSETGETLIVLDGNQIRYFENGKTPKEHIFLNYEDFLTTFSDINYLDTNDEGDIIFLIDTPNNKLHRIELDVSDISYIFDALDIGGVGTKSDPNKFNSPNKVVYQNPYVYVLDYNNHCIKKYTEQLTWTRTYYSDILATYTIESFDIHKDTGFVYLLTADYNMHVFDGENSELFSTLYLGNIVDTSGILDFRFDESGEFFYVLTEAHVYKFSSSGVYIGLFNIYAGMKQIKKGSNRTIITSSKKYIVKTNDIVKMFGIGEGLPQNRWTRNDIELISNEFASDVNYNRSLQRVVDNIKMFRDTLDSKFVLATESTNSGTITYFAKHPIKVSERPIFSDDIENDKVKIGINELHIPQIFNREFIKIYDALEILRSFLDIKTVNASTTNGCQGVFCWSWKAMSCYDLSMPVIKLCNINPITFAELKNSFGVAYAPTKTWGSAIANCCAGTKSPLM